MMDTRSGGRDAYAGQPTSRDFAADWAKAEAKAMPFIYNTPLWKVRRLGGGWYQGETPMWAAPTVRTRDFEEARRWIETQVERFLAENGYVRQVAA